jgi:hypothetical protein
MAHCRRRQSVRMSAHPAGTLRHRPSGDDDLDYSQTGYHVTAHKHCDCAVAASWPPPHKLLPGGSRCESPAPTMHYDRTFGRLLNASTGSGYRQSPPDVAPTADMFADVTSRPEVTCFVAPSSGRAVGSHFYESPVFSHRERLLGD